jgi:hypothetical protein
MIDVVADERTYGRMPGGAEMRTRIEHEARELAHREANGIEVALLWSPAHGGLTVVCADLRAGNCFALAAEPATALDVFHHPYAYAASRPVMCGESAHGLENVMEYTSLASRVGSDER